MPYTPAGIGLLALGGVFAVVAALIAYRVWKRRRVTPEQREQRRRAALVASGKMGDATLIEIREDVLFYCYSVRGVEYTASQDVTALKPFLPAEFGARLAVSVRYDAKNPANSIVAAEQWSGLRGGK